MVKHIVMWKLKEFAAGADKKANAIQMKKRLEALQGVVPGAYKMEVGINYNPGGYDVVLYSEFNDHDALEGYQVHPEHIRVQEFIREVTMTRVVADYMV
ncbi:Dabb family protein [Ethanoligenens harbinense]|uniref:Stress responsive alpha-beta barrel domain-containing protein n=1 Tax=Ethanoligenens harbinense (strain DSM 18485 / JCM 12961 / CGMCC 1.5033 / YUAN-3) TaxID=663278 RepID=E6U8L4_ETHHY|nr:Dabb family protein [Ethanoligenens harbinense]ADU26005.1 Stress responsive alpha-beta barrel domain-containing protein [Ethanoligenens harbinense YUAN-3]AVQ95152.1 stress responsive protein [Ethanoligenens harbinense YUAN-3]AYF37842.1 stress responsive protein [Ethanoligenens harbinense]AYF40565.1 stress responsive protein [Ethanoligenens harbinense]QCN91398.1 Dabb family protein [Ethanoligenens harbinense]